MSLSWSIEVHDVVQSTQGIIKGMGRLSEPEGCVVHAFEQKKGVGRHGRKWVSEPGNLYMSMLLRPTASLQEIPQLSLVTSLAAALTIEEYIEDTSLLKLKWPNDVFIGKEKCGGILLETELRENGGVEWVAVGIGINISNAPLGLGTCVQDYSDRVIDIINFRNSFLSNMANVYSDWQRLPFETLKQKWLDRSFAKDTKIEVKIGVQIETGYFHDLDEMGNLILRDLEYRLKTISAGEVHFLDLEKRQNVTSN